MVGYSPVPSLVHSFTDPLSAFSVLGVGAQARVVPQEGLWLSGSRQRCSPPMAADEEGSPTAGVQEDAHVPRGGGYACFGGLEVIFANSLEVCHVRKLGKRR